MAFSFLEYLFLFFEIFTYLYYANEDSDDVIGGSIKSVNPKISRIGRQKRKNEFFLIWPKEPIWLPVFGNGIKRFHFLSFSSKFANLKIRPQGLQLRPRDLKFDTCLTCSYGRTKRCLNMSFTQFVGHLLNFTRD